MISPLKIIVPFCLFVLLAFPSGGFSAPTPGGGGFFLSDLFFDAPILGLGLGAAGGALATGVAGLAAAGAVVDKINTVANVANAKINLASLGANLVGAGLQGAGLLGGEETTTTQPTVQYRPYRGYPTRYRYNSYGK